MGLPESSRLRRRASGLPCGIDTLLLAILADRAGQIVWSKLRKRSRPPSIAEQLLRDGKGKQSAVRSFSSGEEFERTRAEIVKGGGGIGD